MKIYLPPRTVIEISISHNFGSPSSPLPDYHYKGSEGNSSFCELKLTYSSPGAVFPGVKASHRAASKLTPMKRVPFCLEAEGKCGINRYLDLTKRSSWLKSGAAKRFVTSWGFILPPPPLFFFCVCVKGFFSSEGWWAPL